MQQCRIRYLLDVGKRHKKSYFSSLGVHHQPISHLPIKFICRISFCYHGLQDFPLSLSRQNYILFGECPFNRERISHFCPFSRPFPNLRHIDSPFLCHAGSDPLGTIYFSTSLKCQEKRIGGFWFSSLRPLSFALSSPFRLTPFALRPTPSALSWARNAYPPLLSAVIS